MPQITAMSGATAEPNILRRVRGRAREPRVQNEHVGAVDFLTGQNVLQRHRMRFGRIRSHKDDRLRIANVVVGVGHGAVAPCVGYAGDRRRVTNTRLMVDRIGTPERGELAEQVSAFIGEFRRTEKIHGIRAGLGADLKHLVADLVDGLIPRDLLPFAIDQLHRVFQAAIAVHQFAHRRALGAVRTAIDRAVPGRLLADPDAVLDFGDDRAAH